MDAVDCPAYYHIKSVLEQNPSGKTCVAPGYIMVHKDIEAAFLAKLQENLSKVRYHQSKAPLD